MTLSLIIYMAITSRMAGGGVCPQRPAQLSEILFALPVGIAAGMAHGLWCGLACWVWSYAWMQTGHGTAFHMSTGENEAAAGRKEFLSPVIDPLCRVLGQPLGGSFYCWAFMGLKGLLIHLPLGLLALPGAVLWPACYFIGNRVLPKLLPSVDGAEVAEYLSGASAGFLVGVALT